MFNIIKKTYESIIIIKSLLFNRYSEIALEKRNRFREEVQSAKEEMITARSRKDSNMNSAQSPVAPRRNKRGSKRSSARSRKRSGNVSSNDNNVDVASSKDVKMQPSDVDDKDKLQKKPELHENEKLGPADMSDSDAKRRHARRKNLQPDGGADGSGGDGSGDGNR